MTFVILWDKKGAQLICKILAVVLFHYVACKALTECLPEGCSHMKFKCGSAFYQAYSGELGQLYFLFIAWYVFNVS